MPIFSHPMDDCISSRNVVTSVIWFSLQIINKNIEHQCSQAYLKGTHFTYCCFCFHFGETRKQSAQFRFPFNHPTSGTLAASAYQATIVISKSSTIFQDLAVTARLLECCVAWGSKISSGIYMGILLYTQYAQNRVLSSLKWHLNTVVECVQVAFLLFFFPQSWNSFFISLALNLLKIKTLANEKISPTHSRLGTGIL